MFTTVHKMNEPLYDLGISGWFQLSDCNQFAFSNAREKDVIIRTTEATQNILIGPATPALDEPSMLSVKRDELEVFGNVHVHGDLLTDAEQLYVDAKIISSNMETWDLYARDIQSANSVMENLTLSNLETKAGSVINDQGRLEGSTLQNATVSTEKISDEAITDAKIRPLTLTTASFSNASITTSKIKDAHVTTEKLRDGSVTTDKYRDLSITEPKIATGAIVTRHIRDGDVTTAKLSNDTIISEKIKSDPVLRGEVNVRGQLLVNTAIGSNGVLPQDTSLDVYRKLTLVDENDTRAFVRSKAGNLGVMQGDPSFTLDVYGDIRFSSNLYINDSEYLGFWIVRDGSNISFDHGFVGIFTRTPRSELDVIGDITLSSNVCFCNDTGQTFLSTSGSHLGISESNPAATLDIRGDLAIRNEILSDNRRNVFSRDSVVSDHLWVRTANSDFALDVNGDVNLSAEKMFFNPYHFYINSIGSLALSEGTEYFYYPIVTLRARTDALNSGGLVIDGYIGDIHRTNNMYVRILIASRDTDTDDQKLNVTVTQGDSPSKMVGYCDLELYKEDSNAAPRYYIYLKTRAKSSFALNLYGGEVIQSFNTEWRSSSLTDRPDKIPRLNVKFIKSLIDDPLGNHKEFYGDQYIGGNVFIKGNFVMEAGETLQVQKDIVSQQGHLYMASNLVSEGGHLDVNSNMITRQGDILAPEGSIHVRGDIRSDRGDFAAQGISMQDQHLDVLGRMTLAGTFSNQGDIWTGGHSIRAESTNKTRASFDVFRSFDKKGVQLTVNGTFDEEQGNWYNNSANMGVAQINILTSENKSGENTGFYFNTVKQPLYDEDNPLVFDNWMALRNARLGINEVPDPQETLEFRGNMLMHDGGIMIRDSFIDGNNTQERLHYQALHSDMIPGDKYGMYWGKEASKDENNAMNISYQYNSADQGTNRIDIGFMKDSNVLTITDGRRISLNTGEIETDVTFRGNVKGNDAMMTLTNTHAQTRRIIGFARSFQNVTTGASKWEKIALFKSHLVEGETRNQGSVFFQGVITSKTNTNSFGINMYFDAANDVSDKIMVYSKQANDTFFNSEIDFCLFFGDNGDVHVYMVVFTKDACLNMDVFCAQNQGGEVQTFEDASFAVSVNPIKTEQEYIDFMVQNDDDIQQVRKLLTTRFHGNYFVFTSEGNLGIGNTYPGARLDVSGQGRMESVFLRDSRLEMPLTDGFFVNSKLYFDSQDFLAPDRVRDGFVLPRHFSDDALHAIWRETLSNLADNRVFIDTQGDRIGIFNDAPAFGVDVGTTVTLRNEDPQNKGLVHLSSGAGNGLGVNTGSNGPICALDVHGDINFTGQVLYGGIPWRTSPWTFCNDERHLVSRCNVIIAENVFSHDQERLCVESNMALSNHAGRSFLQSLSNHLGVGLSAPSCTLDIGGDMGIQGHRIYDKDGVMVRTRVASSLLTVSESNIGVYNSNPQHTIDIDGDINLTGRLYRHGNKFNEYLNQWTGSNQGIYYAKNVGVGTRIPQEESLSVLHAMSLSNADGTKARAFLDHEQIVNVSRPIQTPGISFSNEAGGRIMLKSHASNLGINMSVLHDDVRPLHTLDVAGDIGIHGTRIVSSERVLENIRALRTEAVQVSESNMGVRTTTPSETLTVNGSLGIDNGYDNEVSSAVFRIDSNDFLALDASALVTSRFRATPYPDQTGLDILVQHKDDDKGEEAATEPAVKITSHRAVYQHMQSTTPQRAVFWQFENRADAKTAFIGLDDGTGFTNDDNIDEDAVHALTISNTDSIRFCTDDNETEQMRIDPAGNVGVNVVYPQFTLDVGGTGIGIMGAPFVNEDRHVTSVQHSNAETMRTKTQNASIQTRFAYTPATISCKFEENGVYSVTKQSPGYSTLSNIVNAHPRGSVYALHRDDLYLVATDNVGTSIYENYAFQHVERGRHLPMSSDVGLDLFVRDDQSSALHTIGNATTLGSYIELVNPRSDRDAFAAVRARNWNPRDIDAPASHTDSNYIEIKTSDEEARLNADKNVHLCIDDLSYLTLDKQEGRVFIPGGRQFGTNLLQSDGVKSVFADAQGNLTMSTSDARLKEGIRPIEYGLAHVCRLNPISFFWKDAEKKKRGHRRELGLLAQDVENVLPECVGRNEDEEATMYLDYVKAIPVLIKAIQELERENKEIRKILAARS